MIDMCKRYSLDDDLMPIVEGKVELPNVEDQADLGRFLNNLAAVGHSYTPRWGRASIGGRKAWAFFFLTPGAMGGGFDGGGFAVIYGGRGPRVVRFAICKHEKVVGPGANPSRGWHPGHCGKCGFDMSVDSGD